jgi:hypothetical protein
MLEKRNKEDRNVIYVCVSEYFHICVAVHIWKSENI